MGTFVTFGGSQKKLRLETFIKIQNSFGFCQRVSKDDVKISHRFFQEAFWWDILSDTVQWCLPFLPTRTCCSRHTPYQKPTSPQSLSRGHAPWAIHTPGGFSSMLLLSLLETSGGASGSSWSPHPMKLSPSAVLLPGEKGKVILKQLCFQNNSYHLPSGQHP